MSRHTRLLRLAAIGLAAATLVTVAPGRAHAELWTPWDSSLGSPPNGPMFAPAVSSWAKGRLNVFVTGNDIILYHRAYHNGAWTPWDSFLGEVPNGVKLSPTVTSWGPGRLDVFVTSSDNILRHRAYHDGGWTPWDSTLGSVPSGPKIAFPPAAISWGPDRIDLFQFRTDNILHHRAFH